MWLPDREPPRATRWRRTRRRREAMDDAVAGAAEAAERGTSGAYDAAGARWSLGPERVYGRLAGTLVDFVRTPLDGRLVVDVGAGTGVVARAFESRGARVIAVDQSAGMLARAGVPAVVGDALLLPLSDEVADVAAAGFVLSHCGEPWRALAEMSRVTRQGGGIVTSSFAVGATHPVKQIVDQILGRLGFEAPDWYAEFKREREPLVATREANLEQAKRAGLDDVEAVRVVVDLSDLDHADLVEWRLGMAHTAGFVARLEPTTLAAVRADAMAALDDSPPLRLPLVLLRAFARGYRTMRCG